MGNVVLIVSNHPFLWSAHSVKWYIITVNTSSIVGPLTFTLREIIKVSSFLLTKKCFESNYSISTFSYWFLGDIEDNIFCQNFMAMYEIRRVFINILRTKTILSILIAVICIRKLCHDITYILVFICFCLGFFYLNWWREIITHFSCLNP